MAHHVVFMENKIDFDWQGIINKHTNPVLYGPTTLPKNVLMGENLIALIEGSTPIVVLI